MSKSGRGEAGEGHPSGNAPPEPRKEEVTGNQADEAASGFDTGEFRLKLRGEIEERVKAELEKRDKAASHLRWVVGLVFAIVVAAGYFFLDSVARSTAEAKAETEVANRIPKVETVTNKVLKSAHFKKEVEEGVRATTKDGLPVAVKAEVTAQMIEAKRGLQPPSVDDVTTSVLDSNRFLLHVEETARENSTKVVEAKVRTEVSSQMEEAKQELQPPSVEEVVRGVVDSDDFEAVEKDVQLAAPVGTIVAWWGKTAPSGWAICAGQAFEKDWNTKSLSELFGSKLPDLRGYFLRGLSDPGIGKVPSPKRDSGRKLGSTQEWGTGLPKKGFSTDTKGSHTHDVDIVREHETYQQRIEGGLSGAIGTTRPMTVRTFRTDAAGSHSHKVTGGDVETRPMNVAVNWIVRVR